MSTLTTLDLTSRRERYYRDTRRAAGRYIKTSGTETGRYVLNPEP